MGERRPEACAASWESLPARALEVLARACSALLPRPGRPPRAPEAPRVEDVDALVAGLATLAAAVGAAGPGPGEGRDVSADLRRAAELTGGVGEAGWRVSCSAGAAGQERAAEAADIVTCVALTLRVLAELGQRAVPPADAGDRPSR